MPQGFPAPFTTFALQPPQQPLRLAVLAGWEQGQSTGEEVRRENWGVGTRVSTRWGTSGLELGLSPQSPGAKKRSSRGAGKEGGVGGALLGPC